MAGEASPIASTVLAGRDSVDVCASVTAPDGARGKTDASDGQREEEEAEVEINGERGSPGCPPGGREDTGVTEEPSATQGVGEDGRRDEEGQESVPLIAQRFDQLLAERDKLLHELKGLENAEKAKEQSFQDIAKELEAKCFSQQEHIELLEEQLEAAREEGLEKTTSLEKKLVQAYKLQEVQTKEKDVLVHNVALLDEEKDILVHKVAGLEVKGKKLSDEVATADGKIRELGKEKEKLQSAIKTQKNEFSKLQANLEKSVAKRSEQAQEMSKLKEELNSINIKLKWAQNKLKSETEALKETKAQLAGTTSKLQVAREEREQIKSDLKVMITQYQESEEMKSNTLGVKLEKTEKELKQHEEEIADQQELHELTLKELELVKSAHQISQNECQQLKAKVAELSGKSSEQATDLKELRSLESRQKKDHKKLLAQLNCMEELEKKAESERAKLVQLQKASKQLKEELDCKKKREEELLSFSQKLSQSNAELQASKSSMELQLSSLTEERDGLVRTLEETSSSRDSLRDQVASLQEQLQAEVEELLQKLDMKSTAFEQLSVSLEEERELNKALRRKNASSIRDLQKQLQQSKRKIEQLEEAPATLQVAQSSAKKTSPPASGSREATPPQERTTPIERPESITPPVEIFNNMDSEKLLLVEKLCRVKKELARREEKLEFFEEHTHQLTEDIQNKSRVLQAFIMREQTGALAPPSLDAHKFRHAQRPGIMAAVFSGNSRPRGNSLRPEMTLDLSLEISRKMQSVLEDALLKNIVLKESVETLGREISRLSTQLQTYESSDR